MRKILKTITIVASLLLLPQSTTAVNTIIYTANYDYAGFTLGSDTLGGVTYRTVNYPGLYNGGEPGAPSLPIDYIRFSVPYNATNFGVNAVLKNNLIQDIGNKMVYPCQQSRMMDDTTDWAITPPDSSIYYSNAYYPSRNAWVVDEGFLAGENHIVTVAVMPISYLHRTIGAVEVNQLKKAQSVRLTLTYDLSDTLAMYPIIRQDSTLRQEGYSLTRSMVANPQNVEAYAPVEMTVDSLLFINPGRGGDGTNDVIPPMDTTGISTDTISHYGGELQHEEYPYLIVTTQELAHAVRRIAALKRQKGYSVKVVTMDQVMSDPFAAQGDLVRKSDGSLEVAFDDPAGKLRQFLKKYYRLYGTKYVLLAGTDVPYRIHNGYHAHGDLYYSELNSDWRSGPIDNRPELYVGRLLGNNPNQFDNYTDKLLRYEMNPGNGNPSYLIRALYTESVDFIGYLSEMMINLNRFYPDSRLIQENNTYDHPTGCEVIDSINTNLFGLFCTFNHGAPTCIRTCGIPNQTPLHFLWGIDSIKVLYNTHEDLEVGNGLNKLNNKYYPMIYYSPSCMTIPYYKVPGCEVDINYGESFTMGKDYGGPVYIGNSQDINNELSHELTIRFSEEVKRGHYILGEADALSKVDLNHGLRIYGSIYHNYLGDPSLNLWTGIPHRYTNITAYLTDSTITVSGNECTDSTIVSIVDNNDRVQSCLLRSGSVIFSNTNPNAMITLHKHNNIPYLIPMLLQNITLTRSQYIIAGDVIAGYSIDSNRTSGNVIIQSGIDYEIEASGEVRLEGGFKVEKGAKFVINPSCF